MKHLVILGSLALFPLYVSAAPKVKLVTPINEETFDTERRYIYLGFKFEHDGSVRDAQFQVAIDPDFKRIIKNIYKGAEKEVSNVNIHAGRYFWRIIDQRGNLISNVQSFEIQTHFKATTPVPPEPVIGSLPEEEEETLPIYEEEEQEEVAEIPEPIIEDTPPVVIEEEQAAIAVEEEEEEMLKGLAVLRFEQDTPVDNVRFEIAKDKRFRKKVLEVSDSNDILFISNKVLTRVTLPLGSYFWRARSGNQVLSRTRVVQIESE